MCLGEALLLERDVAQAPPGVIVRSINVERCLITPLTIVVVFIGDKLMTTEGMCVCEILV